jgi:thymidylate synthase (FAD)
MTYPIKPGIETSIPRAARVFAERQAAIKYSSDIVVETIGGFGGDWLVCDAARTSSKHSKGRGPRELTEADKGLITSLVSQRHGMPFGHGSLTFFVEAPIFVFREWRTHKILMHQTTDDMGYSEASARYRPLKPLFWIPAPERPLIVPEDHKAMRPRYRVPSDDEHAQVVADLRDGYAYVWESYTNMLNFGVAPEVARAVLPVGIYSSMYVSCNPRSLMHFCSLRVHDEQSTFTSYPQYEIEQAARAAEAVLAEGWPVSHKAWVDNGRNSL